MSAFVVNKGHIDAMVRLATVGQVTWLSKGADGSCVWRKASDDQDALGQMLLDECVKSVAYRYEGSDDLPGPIDAYWKQPYSYSPLGGRMPTPVEGLKLVRCYEYQSCEHPGWKESDADNFCQSLTAHLMSTLPGYEEAPWEWEDR